MDVIKKIANEERFLLQKCVYGRYYHTHKRNEFDPSNHWLFRKSFNYSFEEQIFFLKVEIKNLREYNIINPQESKRILRMLKGGSEMKDLAKVVVNNWREKRIKKYGRKTRL